MPELLLRARTVWTLDRSRPRAEAVGIRDDRIVSVGRLAEVRAALGAPLELDLEDATLVPGLIDAHGHLEMLGRHLREVDLAGARSGEELAELILVRARRLAPGTWVRGRGWDQNLFPGGEFPTREALDCLVPDHPVFLERVDGHAALVNGRALELAAMTHQRGDPAGGRILRDARGQPTGVLLDAALEEVARLLPAPAPAELEAALEEAARRCAKLGLVGVHDAGTDASVFEALQRLEARDALPLRVYGMARWGDPRFAEVIARGPRRGERLSMRAIKFFLDGALGSRGAALFQEYADEPGQRGLWTAPDRLAEVLAGALQRGYQPVLHAIGDRANVIGLDAIDTAQQASGRRDLRPRIEHAQVLRPEDLPRFAALGVVASVQPGHAVSDRAWVEARLGPERLAGAYAWRSLKDAGAQLAFGSDFPIEDPDPLRGLWAACTRGGWRTQECLDRASALAAYTQGAAWAAFEELEAGRIAVGMRADLTAFDLDVLGAPAEALREGRVVLTMVGGRATFTG